MITKILIANRGEIAVRVIRTCKEMGIATVAVYSEADRLSLHTRMADEAYCIGPPPSSESYLNQKKIIEVAKEAHCDAIHPGYGFLAENPDFADFVTREGLIFVGPPSSAIRLLGDKTAARQRMKKAGVPVVPGTEVEIKSEKEAADIAAKLGYPVLIKAVAGGGGKGMRIVHKAEDIDSALRAARSESQSAFGNPAIYIEKYLQEPRHIEFQILADNFGHVIHLGERECSIQRRHQKVVEEAPSPILDEALRQHMGEAAVRAAKAAGYQNAGTVEFLMDKDRNYYFLEVNTRLQVEHPVTEMITGIDLVKEQIKIASGERLSSRQEDVHIRGHAVECRIYAEDPVNDFMPSAGKIDYLKVPDGFGIREDSGIYQGWEISLYYDPIMSKLIAWGQNRQEAIQRMRRALEEYQISGVETTIPFCLMVMNTEKFINGDFDTHFVDKEFKNRKWEPRVAQRDVVAAIAAVLLDWERKRNQKPSELPKGKVKISNWKLCGREANLR